MCAKCYKNYPSTFFEMVKLSNSFNLILTLNWEAWNRNLDELDILRFFSILTWQHSLWYYWYWTWHCLRKWPNMVSCSFWVESNFWRWGVNWQFQVAVSPTFIWHMKLCQCINLFWKFVRNNAKLDFWSW